MIMHWKQDEGEVPLPEHMLQEKGERPTVPDGIMAKVVETIHRLACANA